LFQTALFAGASAEEPQAPPADQTAAQRPADPIRDCLEERVRLLRAEHGVPVVAEHPALAAIARQHSAEMAASDAMYHTGPDVLDGLPFGWRAYGEDVVYGMDCNSMWTAFMDSPPHREIILRSDFSNSGVATARSSSGVAYATVVFMRFAPPVLNQLLGPKPFGKPAIAATPTPAPAPGVSAPVPAPIPTPVQAVPSPSPEIPVISLTPGTSAEANLEAGNASDNPTSSGLAGGPLFVTPDSPGATPVAAGLTEVSGAQVSSKSESYRQDLEVEPGLAAPRLIKRSEATTGSSEVIFKL